MIGTGNKRPINCFGMHLGGSDKGDSLVKGIVTGRDLILEAKERMLNLIKSENRLKTKPYKKTTMPFTSFILFSLYSLIAQCLLHTQRTVS